MKKMLFATALLATASLANAQSSVTLFGTVGGGVRWTNGLKGGSAISYDNDIVGGNAIGFTGSEDLGGGVKAIFKLTAGFSSGNGAMGNVFFSNDAWVGIDSAYGRLTFGRQFNAFEDMALTLDPSNGRGTTAVNVPLALIDTSPFTLDTRFNNTAKYKNKFGGLTVAGSYSVGGVAGNTRGGSNYAVSARYQYGTLLGGTGYQRSYNATASQWGQNFQVGGAWQLGSTRIYANYTTLSVTGASAFAPQRRDKIPDGGIVYQVTPAFVLTAAFYDDIASNLSNVKGKDGHKVSYYAIAEYFLSKRTELYAEVDRNGFSGGYKTDPTNIAALGMRPGGSGVTGVSIGMLTQF